MYLRYIRNKHLGGTMHRGTLYRVHFQPNERGGYNETLITISDTYESGTAATLIYPIGLVHTCGRLYPTFGHGARRSVLRLIDPIARETFIAHLSQVLDSGEETRIEVM